jgi:RHS repeat-associated protein
MISWNNQPRGERLSAERVLTARSILQVRLTRRLFARCVAACLVLIAAETMAITAANAQQEVPQVVTPLRVETDVNGVNLTNGMMKISPPVLSVPGAPHLKFDFVQNATPYVSGKIPSNGFDSPRASNYSVHYGGSRSEGFQCSDFDCGSITGTGSTFRESGFVYRQAGTGAVYRFSNVAFRTTTTPQTVLAYLGTVTYPDGETLSYTYDTAVLPGTNYVYFRATRIDDNLGFYLTITYQPGALGDMGWNMPAQVTIYNSSDPSTPLGQLTYNGDTITDIAGRVFTCASGTVCNNALGNNEEIFNGSMQLPGETLPALQAGSDANNRFVTSVVKDGVPWTYTYANPRFDGMAPYPGYWYSSVTVDGPNGYHNVYGMTVSDHRNVLTQVTDALGRTTKFTFDGNYRPVSITYPELNSVTVAYDSYGNIISKTTTPKPGTGQTAVTETASYPTDTCTNALCYRPTWVRDALGRETDFFYDTTGSLTERDDPPDANGVRRKTFITYDSSSPIHRPSVVRVCGDITTCGTANEIHTEFTYWGSTKLPLTETRSDAATGVSLTTTYTYDNAGRPLVVDGPLPGTSDALYFRYDALGRKTWAIGPLGSNGLRNAKRFTYRDSDDKVIATEEGTVSDPASITLAPVKRTDVVYDGRRNPIREALSSSGNIYHLVERTFDNRNQLICEATRMNQATFGSSLDGCTQTSQQGSFGPDRITQNSYDATGQLLSIQRGVGTSLVETYAAYEYTPNGNQKAMTDADGNRAEMTWDGYDRQKRWIFPSPSTHNLANQADYEEYTYDAVGNRTHLKKRDNATIDYAYDGMNRLTVKAVSASATGAAGYTIYYGYDVRGLQTYARFGSTSGAGIASTYDGFGRLVSSTNNMGGVSRTLSYQYDADDERTRITHPDGTYFTYSYDSAGRATSIAENGATTLASFTYDSAGRRSSLAFAGASTSYTYDPVERLSSLTHDLAGTSADQGLTFSYNPASQIISRAGSNDSYASTTATNVNRPYSVNGLNQYTVAGSATLLYDANGNLASDGTTTYVYDAENRLVSASGAKNATLVYDPNGRLFQTSVAGSQVTQFLYDGDALVGEYDGSGNMAHRYVHGTDATADDPLIWYDYTQAGARRSLITDHQGSIIAVADTSGSAYAVNGYDPWGVPNDGNKGRFQYTGQAWIPELGLYYYKARMYSSRLGRFLQIDPVGYADQVNLYAYVSNDPVDGRDPSGNCDTGSRLGDSAQCRVAEGFSEPDRAARQGPGFEHNPASPDTERQVRRTMADPRVRAATNEAWRRARGDRGPSSKKNEWGFWTREIHGKEDPGPLVEGDGETILLGAIRAARRPGDRIFVHVHPFRIGEIAKDGYQMDSIRISDADRGVAIGTQSILISVARPEPYTGHGYYVDFTDDFREGHF